MVSSSRNRRGANWSDYIDYRAKTALSPLLRHYFEAGIPPGETPIGEVPLVGMDMETTGLDTSRHAIVSIGLVPFTLGRIHLTGRHYWVVRPPRPLESGSVVLHHITHSDIQCAPDLREILPDLLEALAGRIPVVHFRNIERRFLDAAVRSRLANEPLLFPIIDTMAIEATRFRHSWWSRLRHWLGRPPVSIRLADSRARYTLPAYHGHHALRDALATAELFQAQVAHRHSPYTPLERLWC